MLCFYPGVFLVLTFMLLLPEESLLACWAYGLPEASCLVPLSPAHLPGTWVPSRPGEAVGQEVLTVGGAEGGCLVPHEPPRVRRQGSLPSGCGYSVHLCYQVSWLLPLPIPIAGQVGGQDSWFTVRGIFTCQPRLQTSEELRAPAGGQGVSCWS